MAKNQTENLKTKKCDSMKNTCFFLLIYNILSGLCPVKNFRNYTWPGMAGSSELLSKSVP